MGNTIGSSDETEESVGADGHRELSRIHETIAPDNAGDLNGCLAGPVVSDETTGQGSNERAEWLGVGDTSLCLLSVVVFISSSQAHLAILNMNHETVGIWHRGQDTRYRGDVDF